MASKRPPSTKPPARLREVLVADFTWSLQLSVDDGRWRAVWITTHPRPFDKQTCHSLPGSGPGWHRSKQAAIACAEKGLRLQQYRIALQQAWRDEKTRRRRERRVGDRLRSQVLFEEPRCRCGAPATEVDHRLAIAFGGTSERTNLTGVCAACHRAKTQGERKIRYFP
jgi:5-methylcytosine-specific restriction endonuclease McrA